MKSPPHMRRVKETYGVRHINFAEMRRSGAAPLRWRLVAGYCFGGFFFLGGVGVAIAVAVTVAIRMAVAGGWGYAHRFAGVGEVGWDGFGDVAYRADLHYGGLGLL